MLGYGRDFNKVKGKISSLHVRTFCFKESGNDERFFFVNCELCFTTAGVKREVLRRLNERDPGGNYRDENIMLTAQHTHSGPGGFTHHPFYNFPVPGFRPQVFNYVCEAIVESILESAKNLQPAKIYVSSGKFAPEEDVAFNRSLKAYNQNPEVKKRTPYETHLAVDRNMDLLRIDDMNGNPIGEINWFGVHTTSVGNRVNKICGDNKGFASAFFEEEIGGNFNAVFAQQFTGDVSPNFHGKGKNWKKGPEKDEVENAKFNGRLQFKKAKQIWDEAVRTEPLTSGSIECDLIYVDFSNVKVDPEFAGGREDAETDSACHGVAFFSGTPVDGPGMSKPVKLFAIFCSQVIKYGEIFLSQFRNENYRNWIRKKYKVQGAKRIIFETGRGVAFGTRSIKNFFLPGFLDGGIREMKREHRKGALRELPWTPHILPLQLVKLGKIVLAAFPGEITTVAGQRLRDMLERELASKGIEKVVLCTYANNYMGYCVTNEEYQVQCYEGGHTVFGQWTHGAFMTKYREMAREFLKEYNQRSFDRAVQSHVFTEKEMALRTY